MWGGKPAAPFGVLLEERARAQSMPVAPSFLEESRLVELRIEHWEYGSVWHLHQTGWQEA